jgi:hypothetical protein
MERMGMEILGITGKYSVWARKQEILLKEEIASF